MSAYPPKSRLRVVSAAVLLCLYVGLVLAATMWPTPLDQGYTQSIDRVLGVLHRNGVPEWFGYTKVEFTANVLMFVPLGFLATLLLPRRLAWLSLLLVPGFSVGIELAQSRFLSERFATALDVIANSVGAFVGIAAAFVLLALVAARDRVVIARALASAQHAPR